MSLQNNKKKIWTFFWIIDIILESSGQSCVHCHSLSYYRQYALILVTVFMDRSSGRMFKIAVQYCIRRANNRSCNCKTVIEFSSVLFFYPLTPILGHHTIIPYGGSDYRGIKPENRFRRAWLDWLTVSMCTRLWPISYSSVVQSLHTCYYDVTECRLVENKLFAAENVCVYSIW